MRKLILLLITLTACANVSYASFPIVTNNTCEVLATANFEEKDDEPSQLEYILRAILIIPIFVYGLFLLIRAWWRAWRDGVKWVRILTKALMWIAIVFVSLILLVVSMGGIGFSSGMGG